MDAETVFIHIFAYSLFGYKTFGSLRLFFFRCQEGTNSRMGANKGATITLNTIVGNPTRHNRRNAAFFILSGTHGIRAVGIRNEFADGNIITLLQVRRFNNLFNEFRKISRIFLRFFFRQLSPCCRHLYFYDIADTAIDSRLIHGNYLVTLGHVGFLNSFFHVFYSIFNRQYIGQFKESCLQYRIGTVRPQTEFTGNLSSINDIEAELLTSDIPLNLSGKMRFQFIL